MGAPLFHAQFSNTPHIQLLQPPNMPKSANFNEERMAKAFAAAMREKNPNFSKIAREFDMSRYTLSKRVRKAKSPPIPQDSQRNALRAFQEKALINQIAKMRD
jgi:AraC-like DNA-binding protein